MFAHRESFEGERERAGETDAARAGKLGVESLDGDRERLGDADAARAREADNF